MSCSISRIAIRVDASEKIGTGHFMRCLTLADEWRRHGLRTRFISRSLTESSKARLSAQGHEFVNIGDNPIEKNLDKLAHAHWLGTSQDADARDSIRALSDQSWDWLVVDHYALDRRWEMALRRITRKIMVIDDLVDRKHDCDLLLDQTFLRNQEEYGSLVKGECRLLTGSKYCLLRPEFRELRDYSLERRTEPELRRLMISMGGIDKTNITGEILTVVQASSLPPECRITVVMGGAAPSLEAVRQQIEGLPWQTEVIVDTDEMASLMSDCDLAIGAAGSTAWERCCLGLPTIMMVLADNQKGIARRLHEAGATIVVKKVTDLSASIDCFSKHPEKLSALSRNSSAVTDGNGLKLVSGYMHETHE